MNIGIDPKSDVSPQAIAAKLAERLAFY
ncbi:hypothetical protein LCGC14_0330940, partial [marine sediment metagenome]